MYASADYLCKRIYCRENLEYLLVASKKNVLEVNADKSKYMFMPQNQNASRNQYVLIDYSFYEMEVEFKYVGTT
jgi:hypothetical protein